LYRRLQELKLQNDVVDAGHAARLFCSRGATDTPMSRLQVMIPCFPAFVLHEGECYLCPKVQVLDHHT
jgi:hypothetical protein